MPSLVSFPASSTLLAELRWFTRLRWLAGLAIVAASLVAAALDTSTLPVRFGALGIADSSMIAELGNDGPFDVAQDVRGGAGRVELLVERVRPGAVVREDEPVASEAARDPVEVAVTVEVAERNGDRLASTMRSLICSSSGRASSSTHSALTTVRYATGSASTSSSTRHVSRYRSNRLSPTSRSR